MGIRRAMPLAVIVMSLLLTGCPNGEEEGGGGESSPTQGGDASPATPAPTAPPSEGPNNEEIAVLLDALQAPTQGSISATFMAQRLNSLNPSWNVRPGELDQVAMKTCNVDKGALGKYVKYQLPGVDFRAWSALYGLVDLVKVYCNVSPNVVEELQSNLSRLAFAGSVGKIEVSVSEANVVVDRVCDLLKQTEKAATELLNQLIELGSRHRIQPGNMFEFIAGAAIKNCQQLVAKAEEVLEAV